MGSQRVRHDWVTFTFHFPLLDHRKRREFLKNICSIDCTKVFDCMDHNKLWKILEEIGIPEHLTCLLRNLYAGQEATVQNQNLIKEFHQNGTTDGFRIGKGVYWHPAYLTYMQSTSCEMPGWMKHMLESRLLGEKSVTSDIQMTPLIT